MKNPEINVFSEIGRLKKVMLHRPGKELENLMPDILERLLFDDIPYLKIAQEEHDAFANILRNNSVDVVYLEDLVVDSLVNDDIKDIFINEYIEEAGIKNDYEKMLLKEYFLTSNKKDMVLRMMEGVRKSELDAKGTNLSDFVNDKYPFIIDPMPNLYFTRDPFASMGNGISIHKMHTVTRSRETLFAKYIFKFNPIYKGTRLWYDRTEDFSIEGGDVLVLNDRTVAVGISQRTHPNAIEKFANRIITEDSSFKEVLAIDIPKLRTFMHLDTVFTMVDYDKFTIHPNIQNTMQIYVISKNNDDSKITIKQESGSLEDILKKHLNLDNIKLIKCGGNSIIDAAREQWNDGSNTLCIAPGEVIVYSRNHVTNEILKSEGIKTYIMPSSELSRGRGGPRCMSMPLWRENLR